MPDTDRSDPTQPEQEALSALMDGELDAAAAARLAEACRGDARLRASWHRYHLIGDVMRSQDLAQPPGHDAAFVLRLRERLAAEPVLLAPTPAPASARTLEPLPRQRHIPRRAWAASAVAAGVMAVGGVLVVARLQPVQPGLGGAVIAQAPAQRTLVSEMRTPAPAPAVDSGTVVQADDRLLRDAQLDRYLVAHKQWGSSFAMPAVATRVSAAER